MTTYVVMRRCLTGFNEYHYYIPDEFIKIGQATAAVLPNGSVILRHRLFKLCYSHDPDITCVPGCSQPVFKENTQEEFARIFWDGIGKHRIQTAEGTFDVTCKNGSYTFSWKGFSFAVMSAYQEGTPFFHKWGKTQQSDKECRMVRLSNIIRTRLRECLIGSASLLFMDGRQPICFMQDCLSQSSFPLRS